MVELFDHCCLGAPPPWRPPPQCSRCISPPALTFLSVDEVAMMPRTAGQKLRAQVALSCAPRLKSGALPAPCERSISLCGSLSLSLYRFSRQAATEMLPKHPGLELEAVKLISAWEAVELIRAWQAVKLIVAGLGSR